MRWAFAALFLPGCIWITDTDMAAFNDRDGDGLDFGQDCDDSDASVNAKLRFYPDMDGDGFGDQSAQPSSWCEGEQESGYVLDNTDCDDTSNVVNVAAIELCDPIDADEDCNGFADDLDAEAQGKGSFHPDGDGDGYGDETAPAELFCDPPSGYVADSTDCDDEAVGVRLRPSHVHAELRHLLGITDSPLSQKYALEHDRLGIL